MGRLLAVRAQGEESPKTKARDEAKRNTAHRRRMA
jgi:hypothetical protein